MTRNDEAALKLALAQACEDQDRREQLESMLEDRPWRQVAAFAAHVCQCRALKHPPWERPPCGVSEDDDREINIEPVRLLRRMLAAGVSRYDPDPLAALEAAKVPS